MVLEMPQTSNILNHTQKLNGLGVRVSDLEGFQKVKYS